MVEHTLTYSIVLIFAGAALLGTIFLYARQSLIVAYIVFGMLVGPAGIGLIEEPEQVRQIADIGIIFLLYLLGLNLHPQKLWQLFSEASLVTLLSSLCFAFLGVAVGIAFGYGWVEALVIGSTCMFSSTILALKLLPTTALHHRHAGEIIISILLIQDLIAILMMVLLQGLGAGEDMQWELVKLALSVPLLIGLAYLLERYVLVALLTRFDRISEYVFLLAIAWCLLMAQIGAWLGLSHEIGAFIAGVALAASPISRYISDSLKELRDFFLIIFFFALGASFEVEFLRVIALPAIILSVLIILIKPVVFRFLLTRAGEPNRLSWEMGARLGSGSEFGLLLAVIALQAGVISAQASYLIQATTLLTFLISSYLVVLIYPTPIAVSDKLRQD